MKDLTHVDLFSGIAGFALAAQRAGFRTVSFSEVDPYCFALLEKNFPGIPNRGDVRTGDYQSDKGATVLTAGVPCQPASLAGKRRGTCDDRWLWPQALRVLRQVRPTWAIFENPPGILALERGVVFESLLSEMETIGYAVQAIPVPACGVDARHIRTRVWIVAHAKRSERRPDDERGGRSPEGKNGEGKAPGRVRKRGKVLANTTELSEREQADEADSITTGREARNEPGNGGQLMGDPDSARKHQQGGRQSYQWEWPRDPSRWLPEPELGRVAHGIPNRVDRLKGLGNAIVPQVAQVFFEAIRAIEIA